jgi:hypothetical protein
MMEKNSEPAWLAPATFDEKEAVEAIAERSCRATCFAHLSDRNGRPDAPRSTSGRVGTMGRGPAFGNP